MNLRAISLLLAAATVLLPVAAAHATRHDTETMREQRGAEPAPASKPALGTLEDLKAEVERLRERVAALEALKPTMTTMMPDFAERFHVMHRAGDAGDWAVAAHEAAEMKRLLELAPLIDAKTGPLMQAFMTGHLRKLGETIGHGDKRGFEQALGETVASCNGCHKASGSAIRVALDVEEGLSMRHPQALESAPAPKGHTH